MPDNLLSPFFEKGFFAAVGLICTGCLTAIGLKTKSDAQFRRDIFKRTISIEKDLNNKHNHILENYPDKDDFKMLAEAMKDGFKDIKQEIRSGRNE